MPGSEVLVVANGGIETHLASGRSKLNIAIMRPNLSYIENGAVTEIAALPPTMHKGSIRHIAVSHSGEVAFGMQWQGDANGPALVGLHRRGSAIRLCTAPDAQLRAMQGYIGSITFAAGQRDVAVTSPRGGLVQMFDTASASYLRSDAMADACGVASCAGGLIVTSGTGDLVRLGRDVAQVAHPGLMWDNHLVAL